MVGGLHTSVNPCFFFFNEAATTEISTLSYTTLFRSLEAIEGPFTVEAVEEALTRVVEASGVKPGKFFQPIRVALAGDRKSTRLNSSHANISYAVFCLKKK